jgi:short-subunit dehydrogenase
MRSGRDQKRAGRTAQSVASAATTRRLGSGAQGGKQLPVQTGRTSAPWARALVTGASSGIGEWIARGLAAEGAAVILVARRRERLEALAADLRSHSGAAVEILGADLTNAEDLLRVEQRLASTDHPVDLLVNNAGGMHLAVFPGGDHEQLVRLNIMAVIRLTAAVLPTMRQRRRGTILNISSGAAFHPHPYAAVYGGTKAFLNSFSEAIREENRSHGIGVTVVCPGFTRTELAESSGFDVSKMPRLLWTTPEQVAERALAAARKNVAVCVPGLLNKIDAAFGYYAPRWLVVKSVASSTRRFSKQALR